MNAAANIRHIYRWDLDKTYLKTEFETIRGLLKTAFQKPEDRANIPGAIAFLRELSREREDGRVVVTFVSGSPSQMRDKIERKLAIDGIKPDRLILKPTLENILRGRFKAVRGQVGYKLDSLLTLRGETDLAPETLFGDDAEQDAFIYCLYADLVAGRLDAEVLRDILVEAEVYADPIERILAHAVKLRPEDTVGRVFINLESRTAPGRFLPFGARVIPIVNYFQAAIVLWSDGVLDMASVFRVAAGMIERDDYSFMAFANSFQDLLRRRVIGSDAVARLEDEAPAVDVEVLPPGFAERFVGRVRALAPREVVEARELLVDSVPDYIEILRADRALKDAVTQRRRGLFE